MSVAASRLQSRARGLFARKAARERRAEDARPTGSRKSKIGIITKLTLFEAVVFSGFLTFTIVDLYVRVGPDSLWRRAEANAASNWLLRSRFVAYVLLVFTDGILHHWQVRFAMYSMVTVGSLVVYLPFLLVKLPFVGSKLLDSGLRATAYDQAGHLRRLMSRFDAFEKYKIEQRERLCEPCKSKSM